MPSCRNCSNGNGSFIERLLQCNQTGAQHSPEGWHTHFPVGVASTRCTHSASRRRRSTASPSGSGSGSGSVWGPRTRPSSRRGRLPAERFFRGATALQGSGAATVAAMPLTSPLRARAAAAQLASRHTRTSSPSL